MQVEEYTYTDPSALADTLALRIADHLREALRTTQQPVLVVAGGRSPIDVFEVLSEQSIDWAKMAITLVDERWVEEQHPDSNARLVRHHLLKHQAAVARFFPWYTGDVSANAAVSKLRAQFEQLTRPFAAVLLGIGPDGHFASLFPDSPQLMEALAAEAPTVLPQQAPVEPVERISLTLRCILETRRIFIQFSGASKLEAYQKARLGKDPRWPVSYLLHQTNVPVEVHYT